ncbi:MAG: hypothetical protein JW827_00945 [Spirochaetes bacterium]|nr:hypothetical protein [Spirochaetota bacterium]
MEKSKKLIWLKRVLLLKVILIFTAWAPALIAWPEFLKLLGIPWPDNPIFLRLFGALQTSLGVAYIYAYKDPLKNKDIVKVGIFENGLMTLTLLFLGFTTGISPFLWISVFFTTFFCVSFLVFKPAAR